MYKNQEVMQNLAQIKQLVSQDVWERIMYLQPKTKVEFFSIYGLGQITFDKIKPYVDAIEQHFLKENRRDLAPEMKLRLEILRDRLINISQRNNIIWNTKETSNRLIDLSKLTPSSIEGIKSLINNPKKKIELEIEDLNIEEQKKTFTSIYRENERQKMEKGRSILYIAPAMIVGKTKVEDKDIKLRAPLFMFPVELILNKNNDKWYLTVDKTRDVVTNPFIERYVIRDLKDYSYNFDLSLEENINYICNIEKRISNNYGMLNPFSKITSKDPWGYSKGEFAITNHLLLGLFSDFSNEIEAEIDHLIYNMDSTPMLNRFLENADFHSRDEVATIKKRVDRKISDDRDLTYTNQLNEQQLRALKFINEKDVDGLTIWGPPGTGKSETIISMVENAVAKGLKVAVVSEKQAALNVIKDRLNVLKNNSIMVSDIKDKLSFFNQLSMIINKEYFGVQPYPKSEKQIVADAYKELDIIYEKFGFNSKDIFEQVRDLFIEPLYETPLSNKMQYEDPFFNFRDIDLEIYNTAYDFIESIDSRDRMKLLINVSNNYFGKFASFSEIESSISDRIGEIIEETSKRKDLIPKFNEFKDNVDSMSGFFGRFKKKKYASELNSKYGITNTEFKTIELGTFVQSQTGIIDSINEEKVNLIKELDWATERRIDIDVCLGMERQILNLITLIDIEKIHESKDAIKINLTKRLLKSPQFITKFELLRDYENKIAEIKSLQESFAKGSENQIKNALDNNLKISNLNKRENNIAKLANRKRPMAIRSFMNEYPVEMDELVKVWLLQPEVIPAMFELHQMFDIVIFDEASQIFLERSLPAIARAKKLVVLGDEKQLGPSSFFAGRIISEDSDDEIIEDNESLLTYSRAKLPEIMLKKHYRSRDVNLIKFSNERYYEGELNFINDNSFVGDSLKYEFINDSDYSNGLNKKEAERVIELLQSHKDKYSKETIGVITANQKQEVYLFNQLISKHYELFEWLKESGAFIKSIENVQGDERDIIIFSTTYGPEEGNQRVNFGPINQELGSNRINVAITRAKKQMIVVSSIDLEQAAKKVATSLHQGPRDFIDYITFAKSLKNKEDRAETIFESTNPFEVGVYRTIEEMIDGTNLGIEWKYSGLGYILDIVIYNKITNENLFAILLDSELSGTAARERDFLSTNFLEARGWKVHRIWSPNWWTRNNYEVTTLKSMIEEYSRGHNE